MPDVGGVPLRLVVDESIPAGTVEARSGGSVARIINIGTASELPADPSVLFGATRCRCSLTPVAPPPDLLVTMTAQANELQRAFAAMGAALAPLADQAHRAMAAIGRASRAGTVAELEDATGADWPAQGATCAHVCGADADHRCDAKASTSITHPLPSGGKRTLPLCGPCHSAESAEATHA